MLQLGEEIRVLLHRRIALPLDLDRAGHAAHPVELGARAHIDQLGAGGELHHLPGFGGRERALVGQPEAFGALVGERQQFRQGSHAHIRLK
jgi:hypothetical protein